MVPSDSYITNHLFWLGLDSYEPGEPDWWARLAATHDRALELGANVGLYSVVGAIAAQGRPYVAVEPNPASCDALRANLAVNGLGDVSVVEAAVVGRRDIEEVVLRFPDRDVYDASAGAFVDGAVDLTTSATRSLRVPAVAAADLVDGVDLLKLDIEGLEVEVLEAVRSWITETAPTVVVEVRDDAHHLQDLLRDLIGEVGYACVVLRDGSPRRVRPSEVTSGRLQAAHGPRDVTLVEPTRLDDDLLGPEPPAR